MPDRTIDYSTFANQSPVAGHTGVGGGTPSISAGKYVHTGLVSSQFGGATVNVSSAGTLLVTLRGTLDQCRSGFTERAGGVLCKYLSGVGAAGFKGFKMACDYNVDSRTVSMSTDCGIAAGSFNQAAAQVVGVLTAGVSVLVRQLEYIPGVGAANGLLRFRAYREGDAVPGWAYSSTTSIVPEFATIIGPAGIWERGNSTPSPNTKELSIEFVGDWSEFINLAGGVDSSVALAAPLVVAIVLSGGVAVALAIAGTISVMAVLEGEVVVAVAIGADISSLAILAGELAAAVTLAASLATASHLEGDLLVAVGVDGGLSGWFVCGPPDGEWDECAEAEGDWTECLAPSDELEEVASAIPSNKNAEESFDSVGPTPDGWEKLGNRDTSDSSWEVTAGGLEVGAVANGETSVLASEETDGSGTGVVTIVFSHNRLRSGFGESSGGIVLTASSLGVGVLPSGIFLHANYGVDGGLFSVIPIFVLPGGGEVFPAGSTAHNVPGLTIGDEVTLQAERTADESLRWRLWKVGDAIPAYSASILIPAEFLGIKGMAGIFNYHQNSIALSNPIYKSFAFEDAEATGPDESETWQECSAPSVGWVEC
jgi:hypothetical protein